MGWIDGGNGMVVGAAWRRISCALRMPPHAYHYTRSFFAYIITSLTLRRLAKVAWTGGRRVNRRDGKTAAKRVDRGRAKIGSAVEIAAWRMWRRRQQRQNNDLQHQIAVFCAQNHTARASASAGINAHIAHHRAPRTRTCTFALRASCALSTYQNQRRRSRRDISSHSSSAERTATAPYAAAFRHAHSLRRETTSRVRIAAYGRGCE